MWCKVVLITASVLVLSQALDRQKGNKPTGKKASRGLVEISNATYWVDEYAGVQRDGGKILCASMNMTLVSFEGDVEKWRSINQWLLNNGLDYDYFWTDAVRDERSSEWYWETSGNILSEDDFYWGIDQPSLPSVTVRSCIDFSYQRGGYDDDECSDYYLGVVCQ